MKKSLLILILFFSVLVAVAQQTFTITASGLSYTPDLLNVNVGDKVTFNAGFSHPVRQVSENTWNANGTTLLSDGFDFSNGAGVVSIDSPGTIYYVCVSHVSAGMKGRIIASVPADIEKVSGNDSFKIYPNPVLETLNLVNFNNSNIINVKVIDFLGRTQISIDNPPFDNNLLSIDLSMLGKGAYFLLIDTGNNKLARKFMKH